MEILTYTADLAGDLAALYNESTESAQLLARRSGRIRRRSTGSAWREE